MGLKNALIKHNRSNRFRISLTTVHVVVEKPHNIKENLAHFIVKEKKHATQLVTLVESKATLKSAVVTLNSVSAEMR